MLLPGNDEIASLCLFINWRNTLFKIRCWTFDVRCSSFKSARRALSSLTYRGVDIIGDIKKLEMTPSEETFELLKDLIKVAEGIGNIRQGIMQLLKTPPIFGSAIMPSLQRTLNDIDDAEPIFDKLSEDIANWDLKEVRQTTDNLLERLFGSDSSKSTSPNKANSADAKSRAADLRRSAAGSKKLQMNFKATKGC